MKSSTLEMREGITYQTGVDVTGFPSESLEEIPPPPIPVLQLPLPSDDYTRVYFDLETTGLGMCTYVLHYLIDVMHRYISSIFQITFDTMLTSPFCIEQVLTYISYHSRKDILT